MKYKQLICFLTLLAICISGFTQNNIPKPKLDTEAYQVIAKKEANEISAMLKLTQAQAKELEKAELQFASGYVALANSSLSGTERRVKLLQLQKSKETSFQKILTPSQWQTYLSFMEARKKKAREEFEQRRRNIKEGNPGNGE